MQTVLGVSNVAVAMLLALTTGPLRAQTTNLPTEVAGAMCARLPGGAGNMLLPLRRTHVRMEMTGAVVATTVSQRFVNDTDHPLEAVYIFPLPARAAVTDMALRTDDRLIKSVVQERKKAKQTYEKAKREGRRAALLEQGRPNIFTTSVANFLPGQTVDVGLSYMEAAEYQSGMYSLTFPMVVGQRYIPGGMAPHGATNTCQGAGDARRINPPVLPAGVDPAHELSLEMVINGLPVKRVTSGTHEIDVRFGDAGDPGVTVTLARRVTIPNCEFNVRIHLEESDEPEINVVESSEDGTCHALITVLPPVGVEPDDEQPEIPRDVVFLIDTSGSMSGESIGQAKAGLERCLDMLAPGDRFTIVRFAGDYSTLSSNLLDVAAATVEEARKYIACLAADGGTEMQDALAYVLGLRRRPGAMALVIFLTDGDVGNEDSLMRLLSERLGGARLFTFGIGSAPNEFLVRKMGELGRGQARFIRTEEDIGAAMADFFRTLDAPVLTDVSVAWFDYAGDGVPGVEYYPSPCPDLFLERPVQVVARYPSGAPDRLVVSGLLNGRQVAFEYSLASVGGSYHDAVGRLFGRRKIDRLMADRLAADQPSDISHIESGIIAASLKYQLVSKYTSRVAVEEKVEQTPDGTLATVNVPVPLPRGWSASGFVPTATNDPLLLAVGVALVLLGGLWHGISLRRARRRAR